MLPLWLRSKVAGLRAITRFDNRFELLVNRIFYRHSGLAVYRLGALEILVDHRAGDQTGVRHVLTSNMYRRFLERMILEGPLAILDLGAASGGFPLLLEHAGFELGRVCCVEMHPLTFARLECNTRVNLANVEVRNIHAAITADGRKMELSLGPGGTGDSIYHPNVGTDSRTYTIPGMTLAAVCELAFPSQTIDIVKMDIERAEYEVLLGDGIDALRRCRYLLIEIHEHPQHTPQEIIDALAALDLHRVPFDPGEDDTVHLFANRALKAVA